MTYSSCLFPPYLKFDFYKEQKADFEEYAEKDLQDTKLKTVEIYGNNGAKVIVQNAATVKPISWVVIKEVLGKTVPDFIKEETKLSLTDVAKTMLANMFKGDYIEDTLSNVVAHMTPDQKKQTLLMKRLKGKYKQDQKSKCQNSNNLYVAKVVSTSPFKLKLYDQTITEHIYVNNSFLKTSSKAIDSNITWDENHDYVPSSLLSFTRKMFKADLLSAGDTVIVLLDGVSFYVLERVTKVA